MMKNNPFYSKFRKIYLEMDGKDFDAKHFRQNIARYLKMIESILPFSSTAKILDLG